MAGKAACKFTFGKDEKFKPCSCATQIGARNGGVWGNLATARSPAAVRDYAKDPEQKLFAGNVRDVYVSTMIESRRTQLLPIQISTGLGGE